MHDVAVALHLHHVGQLHRGEVGDPADVVAAEIDKHDVLGALLRVGEQFRRQGAVLGLVLAARSGAGERSDRHEAVLDAHEDLGRTADQAEVAERQIEQEGARIDHPKHPINVERRGRGLDVEALAGDDLEDVAGLDVFLTVTDDLLVRLARQVRLWEQMDRAVGVDVGQFEVVALGGEPGDQFVGAVAGVLISGLRVNLWAKVGVRDDQDRLADVVEDDHPVVKRERQVG